MAYLAASDLTAVDFGADIAVLTNVEASLDVASRLVDGCMGRSLQYQTITGEAHRLPLRWTDEWMLRPRVRPVRVVTSITYDTRTPIAGDFGDVEIDVTRNAVYVPRSYWRHPYQLKLVRIAYTAGYDDGTIQADGLSVPVPGWLAEATRMTIIAMIDDLKLRQQGLGGLQSIQEADARIMRSRALSDNFAVPSEVRQFIADNMPGRYALAGT